MTESITSTVMMRGIFEQLAEAYQLPKELGQFFVITHPAAAGG
jgi:hypothetical protein